MPQATSPPTSPDAARTLEQLLEENAQLKRYVDRVQQAHAELKEVVDEMTNPPWFPALVQAVVPTPLGPRAFVWAGAAPRLVANHHDVDLDALVPGQQVYLSRDQNTIMAVATERLSQPTETATFDRITPSGKLVARSRDEEILLEQAAELDVDALRPGDRVLYDRASHIALGMLEAEEGKQYLLEDAGDLPRSGVGGSRACLDELVAVLSAGLLEPELAQTYGLGGQRAVLLYGAPGCGKTLAARTAASELQRLTGRRCRFSVVRPGEFEAPYVGQSEENIRACFRGLRDAAGDDLAVLFLDEIEAVGRIRGGPGSHHSDRFLAALLAEIDGFADRGQVAIIAATNRKDLIDPALLSRLSDVEIAVKRPDMRAAREIFGVHLPKSVPFRGDEDCGEPGEKNGTATLGTTSGAESVRQEVLDTAVSRLYAPNAATEICELLLRDGTRRIVQARELASGRLIEQVARAARQRAFRRHIQGEPGGVTVSDMAAAVEEAVARLSTLLSVHNARAYLDDLPDDVDVVRVDAIGPRPPHAPRYVHVH